MLRALLVVVFVSVSAHAQERVRVAVHPLVAPGIDDARLVGDLNREVQDILASTGRVTLVAPQDVEKQLAGETGKCPPRGKERTDCLERVALATRAVYIIAVTVKRLGKEYELSATIADADRVLLEQPESLTVTDTGAAKIDVALKYQLKVLLIDKLKAGSLPPDPRMRNPPPAVVVNPPPVIVKDVPPPPMPPPEEPKASMSTMRLGGIVAGGFGLGAGITAIVLGLLAQGEASRLMVRPDGVLLDASMTGLVTSSRNKATIGAAMGGVAGVAIVAAVLMFVMGPAEESKTTVSPVAFAGGAGVAFTGVLP